MRTSACVFIALTACAPAPGPESPEPDAPDVVQTSPSARPRAMRYWTAWQLGRALSDLLGEPFDARASLPADPGGWAGHAAAQSISPSSVEAWSDLAGQAADRFVARAFDDIYWDVADLDPSGGEPASVASEPDASWWAFEAVNQGSFTWRAQVDPPVTGTYVVQLRGVWAQGWEDGTGSAPSITLSSSQGGRPQEQRLTATWDAPGDLRWSLGLEAEPATLTFTAQLVGRYTAVLLDEVRLSLEAADVPVDGPARQRWVVCGSAAPAACVRQVLTAFLPRAWRRPVTDEELAPWFDLADQVLDDGGSLEDALRWTVRGVLMSPSFLFHAEDVSGLAAGTTRPATPHERAARLALLLWGSVPDDALALCAEAGGLSTDALDDCSLEVVVDRMLTDSRADAVEEDFARLWLGLDGLTSLAQEAQSPIDPELFQSMRDETTALFRAIRTEDLPLTTLVDAPFTQVDARLADLYGVAGPTEGTWARVTLEGDRRGLMGHASTLTLTSHPDRTSPVERGAWVLRRLLCDPPQPPPPNLPQLPAEQAASGDVRALLEAHRSQPSCAACHDVIDPLGLPLEGFDRLGRTRATYLDGTPIDASGQLPQGLEVSGLADLAGALAADPAVTDCLSRHVATWALAAPWDEAAQDAVEAATSSPVEGRTLRGVLRALAQSSAVTHVAAGDEP